MNVIRFINNLFQSNTYIIKCNNNNNIIIIDPCDNEEVFAYIKMNKLCPVFIFLTHEHFDHISGVNKLKDLYNVKIVCSRECSLKIIDKRKNLSLFYDQVGFNSCKADILVEEIKYRLHWNNHLFEFINTPGHTEGSICIYTESVLFTGDTLIKNEFTVTKLPSGSKEKLSLSLDKLIKRFTKRNPIVFAGHGESFSFSEIAQ